METAPWSDDPGGCRQRLHLYEMQGMWPPAEVPDDRIRETATVSNADPDKVVPGGVVRHVRVAIVVKHDHVDQP